MRTANPALSEAALRGVAVTADERMSLAGTVQKSFILVLLLSVTAIWSWQNTFPQGWSSGAVPQVPAWYFPLIIATLVLAFIIIFKKTTAPYLAPVYALGQGLMLGTISALFEVQYPGIAVQAVLCTAGVFVALLMAYRSGLIPVTEKFRLGVVAATGGIAFVYIISLLLGFFGINMPFIHDSGPIGIGISVFIVIVAALNLILDFDFIEKGSQRGLPKYMEWYASFGLLVTLIWLYLEILRLLAKTRRR